MLSLSKIINYFNGKRMGQAARIRAACYRLLCAQIGNHVRIAKPDQISGMEFLFIGSNVAIGSNARIEAIRTY